MVFVFGTTWKGIFFNHCIIKLAKIICHTKKSVTLLSEIIAIFSCNSLCFDDKQYNRLIRIVVDHLPSG